MKRKLAMMMAAIMTACSLTACGGGGNDMVGYYKIVEMEQEGEDMSSYIELLEENDLGVYLVIEEDGEGYIDMAGETSDLEWDKKTISVDGEEQEYTYKKGKITLESEEDEIKMVFEKMSDKEVKKYKKNQKSSDDDEEEEEDE
ncbi:MAG: hypothetical protein K6B72_05345 [Lachnospiraceae bacterium]|nr:hypothetical protein [Lachnospiraceae bacterium]